MAQSQVEAFIAGQPAGRQDTQMCAGLVAVARGPEEFYVKPFERRGLDVAVYIPASQFGNQWTLNSDARRMYDESTRGMIDTLGKGGSGGENHRLFEFDGNRALLYSDDLQSIHTLNRYFKAYAGVPGTDVTQPDVVTGGQMITHGKFTLTYFRRQGTGENTQSARFPVEAGLTPFIKPVRDYLYIYKRDNGRLVFLTSANQDKFPLAVAVNYKFVQARVAAAKGQAAPADPGLIACLRLLDDLTFQPITVNVTANGQTYIFPFAVPHRTSASGFINGTAPVSPRSAAPQASSSTIAAQQAVASQVRSPSASIAPLSPRSPVAAQQPARTSAGMAPLSPRIMSPRSPVAAQQPAPVSPRSPVAVQQPVASTGGMSPISATTILSPRSPVTAQQSAPLSPRSPVAAQQPVASTGGMSPISATTILSPRSPVAAQQPVPVSPRSGMLNPSSPVTRPLQSTNVVNIPVPINVTQVGTFQTRPDGSQVMSFNQPPASVMNPAQPPPSVSGYAQPANAFASFGGFSALAPGI